MRGYLDYAPSHYYHDHDIYIIYYKIIVGQRKQDINYTGSESRSTVPPVLGKYIVFQTRFWVKFGLEILINIIE